eukprot:74385_1
MFLANLSGDTLRPSLFELIAQDRLFSDLFPAFRFALSRLATHFEVFQKLAQNSNEVYHVLLYFLERHYILMYDSSFAESFYGLRRAPVSEIPDQAPAELSGRGRKLALLQLLLFPYIRNKLQDTYERMKEEDVLGAGPRVGRFQRFRSLFLKIFPYLHASYEALVMLFQLAYLFDKTSFYSPFLWLLGQKLQRVTRDDMMDYQERTETTAAFYSLLAPLRSLSFYGRVLEIMGRVRFMLARYAKIGILLFVFGYKFVDWFYSAEAQVRSRNSLPVPPPPGPAKPSDLPSAERPPRDPNLCPLCKRVRTNPACDTSGYVYCYPCIFNYVQRYHRSPVTFAPCQEVRKIYES